MGVLLTSTLVSGACEEQAGRIPRHAVTITVESDPGVPLEGVAFDVDGEPIGESDEHGLVHTILEGPEGTTLQVHHTCPEGYASAEDTQSLALIPFRSLDPEADTSLQMTVRCEPTEREAAFVVSTGFEDIPVMINGREVGVTNAEGVAHTVLDASPGQSFEVTLALADFERIRPRNVRETFTLGRQSDVFVFSPELELEPEPRRRRRRRRRQPSTMRITRIE
jgi:hypothetical protein